jgi:hypothetical protein
MIGNHYEDSCYSFTMGRLNLAVAFASIRYTDKDPLIRKTTVSVDENKIFLYSASNEVSHRLCKSLISA